jgi:hypothetical protein
LATEAANLPDSLQARVEAELSPGERIVWADQPIPALLARNMLPLVYFGVVWTTLCIAGDVFWTYMTWKMGTPIFALFSVVASVPFLAIGVGMLCSPHFMRRSARRTIYVLTDRRAILFGCNWRGTLTVRSFDPCQLNDLVRNQHADGSGDLVLTRDVRRDVDGHNQLTDVGFLAVREVKKVEDRVRALVQSDRQ